MNRVLLDGGGYGRGHGMKGGLVCLPVKDRDILICSHADTGGGKRKKLTVWASFDGGKIWLVKRLVYAPHGAYWCLDASRPDTPDEGVIYPLLESGPDGRYTAMLFARLNLSWILEGEPPGDGTVPQWEQCRSGSNSAKGRCRDTRYSAHTMCYAEEQAGPDWRATDSL